MITASEIVNNCDMSKVKTVLEIGTGTGDLAEFILKNLRENGNVNPKYIGFDVFEDYGPHIPGCDNIDEHQKVYMKDVLIKLRSLTSDVELFKGQSIDTVAAWANSNETLIDLVIINGSSLYQNIMKDFFLTNPFYKHGTVIFFDYSDGESKELIDTLDWYDPKEISPSTTCITWKKEGTGPIEFISEPGPI